MVQRQTGLGGVKLDGRGDHGQIRPVPGVEILHPPENRYGPGPQLLEPAAFLRGEIDHAGQGDAIFLRPIEERVSVTAAVAADADEQDRDAFRQAVTSLQLLDTRSEDRRQNTEDRRPTSDG